MNALDINFIAHRRLASPLGLLLLVAGVLAFGTVAMVYLDAQEALQRAQDRQARASAASASARKRASSVTVASTAAPAAALAVAQLRLPWNAVLGELDGLADSSVALLKVEGQGPTRALHLTGEAKTMAHVVAYIARMRQSPSIESAHLAHHEGVQSGAVKLIRFSVEATWRPEK